nr:uncharacterized protein perm1 [Nerophis lumbriciformis]
MQRNIEGTLHEHDIMQRNIDKTLHESFHWERMDSNDFSDSVEFFSLQSSGSESYLSAAESVDQDLLEDSFKNQQMVCLSSSSSCSSQPNEVCGSENLHGRGAAISCGDQACVGSTAPGESFINSSRELELSMCCGSLRSQPLPEVIVTQVADSPEAYAQAAGHKQSVYAISAFWEEMEKLTINDILHLRTTRSPPLSETSDVPTQTSSLVDPEEHHLTHGGLTDFSDAGDSDYFTQASDSKADRSSWDFSVCDFEEDYWQFLGTSRNTSPDLSCKTLADEEETRSEDFAGRKGPQRRMTKTKSVQNVQALKTEDLSMEAFLYNDDKCETVSGDKLGSMSTVLVHGKALEPLTWGTMHWDPEDTFLEHSDPDILFLLRESHKWKPIPIFSCSHPTVRELTLPEWSGPFLSTDAIPPAQVLSHALLRLGGPIPFHDKGSIWCRRSGQRKQGSVLMSTLEVVSPPACEQQRILGTIQTPVRLLQQSDLCLVCIAFASWVLTSSDPESADAWKTALLANVSALSAIQYLRQRK